MERLHVKILATFITVVLMLIAVFIPFKIVSKFNKLGSRGTRILDILGCFTGGIFLGTCLLFLLPEVIHLMSRAEGWSFMGSFPVAEGIMVVGFVGIMFLERLVHSCRRTKKQHADKKCGKEEWCGKIDESSHLRNDANGSIQYSVKHGDDVVATEVNVEEKREIKTQPSVDLSNDEDEILIKENSTKAVILFIALSLDEFLGGISMGLQRTSTAVWGILVGLLAHETVVGFSFGLQLASLSKARTGRFAIVLGLAYALIGPFGAIVGTLLGELSWTSEEKIDSVNGVLQGLATGVFLYVTFFEILNGKIHSRSRYIDLLAVTVGISIMAIIAAIPNEESFEELDINTTIPSINNEDNPV